MTERCEPAIEDTRRRLLEAADFMLQGRAVYVPDLLLTAARQLGHLARAPVTPPAVVAALEAERDDWERLCTIAEPEVAALRQEVARAGKACFDAQQETVFYRAEVARMKKAASTINEEVCQILGAALGYPWLKDDQTNFPGATEADGVCVGDHVAESLAAEAAAKLATVAALVEALERIAEGDHPEGTSLAVNNNYRELESRLRAIARAALALYRGDVA